MNESSNTAIPDDILDSVNKCTRGFSCRKSGWRPCGAPVKLIDGKLLHLQNVHSCCLPLCNYILPFDSGWYCTCPARIEIYKQCGL